MQEIVKVSENGMPITYLSSWILCKHASDPKQLCTIPTTEYYVPHINKDYIAMLHFPDRHTIQKITCPTMIHFPFAQDCLSRTWIIETLNSFVEPTSLTIS